MPQMGVSVAEGTIVEWRKRPGDWVEADEPVCDVTTDKVDVEIPSPASGRLERILVEPGATVPVGTPAGRDRRGGASPARRTRRRASGQRVAGAGGRRRDPGTGRRQRRGGSVRVPLAGGAADRRQAPRRPLPGQGHRDRRARAQEGRPGLHRVGGRARLRRLRRSPSCTPSPPTNPRRPTAPRPASGRGAGAGAARADVADAPGDRPPHGREPAHGGSLHDDRRGRPLAGRAPGGASCGSRCGAAASS